MSLRRVGCIASLAVLVSICARGNGQGSPARCGVAPVVDRDSQPNIFSEQQEIWLGQVESDLIESQVVPVRDAALGQRLQSIVDRLVATLPPTRIKFRVTLVDSDEVNGFSIAGGHIYILRKLAAVAKSDDELAGVLGHEIGHIISHQFAFETTREMKRLLNVTSLGDEADIRSKYESMLDAEYHDKHPELGETDRDQEEADRIGLYATSAAGYRPQAYAEFWNRVFFVEGKTGSRIGDLLHFTKPNQKRLRSIGSMVAALPAGCGSGVRPDEQSFSQWHDAVVANQKGAPAAQTPAVSEVTLAPPLRMELDQLRFSPDGKLILAQDQSSIFVVTRDPLTLRYRIDADGAMPASFSPDSQSVTFSTPGLHVEQWSAQERKLIAAHEMLPRRDCYDTRLSPDGRTLVCVEFDLDQAELGLALLDTDTSNVIWEKKYWMSPGYPLGPNLLFSKAMGSTTPFFISSYSADNNVLLFAGGDDKVAFDFRQRAVIKTGGGIRGSITGEYAFLGNDKVAGINILDRSHSAVFSFPDGKVLSKLAMPFETVASVTNPGANAHVLLSGHKDLQIGIADLSAGKLVAALKTHALDEYDGTMVGEALGGALVVAKIGNPDMKQQKHILLPLSPLPSGQPAALSKDGKYLALSTRHRGGVWDVATGKQLALVHGFTDASWDDTDTVYMDVPKDMDVERHIAQISMTTRAYKDLSYKVTDETHMRYGRLTDWKEDDKKKTWTLSQYDPATDKTQWTRIFADRYFTYTASYGNRDLIFSFTLDSHTAKEALKANGSLESEAQAIKNKSAGRLIQVLNGKNGEEEGSLVVEIPPNFAGTDGLNRAGDLLYVAGVDDRTAVYSISSGKQLRDLIGYVVALDPSTGRVFTANRVGEGVVYDPAGSELAHYQLGDPIRFAFFREGAAMVTVLTADQKVRTLQVQAAPTNSSQAAALAPAKQ